MTYLGTNLSPEEYYVRHSARYHNPHSDEVRTAISEYVKGYPDLLQGRIVDLGCGPGLVTSALLSMGHKDVTGVDSSPVMVERYRKETGMPALQASFWDELPKADSLVSAHALHLCPESRLHEAMWRIAEAGVKTMLVVSPLKQILDRIRYCGIRTDIRVRDGFAKPGGKTVWVRGYGLSPR